MINLNYGNPQGSQWMIGDLIEIEAVPHPMHDIGRGYWAWREIRQFIWRIDGLIMPSPPQSGMAFKVDIDFYDPSMNNDPALYKTFVGNSNQETVVFDYDPEYAEFVARLVYGRDRLSGKLNHNWEFVDQYDREIAQVTVTEVQP